MAPALPLPDDAKEHMADQANTTIIGPKTLLGGRIQCLMEAHCTVCPDPTGQACGTSTWRLRSRKQVLFTCPNQYRVYRLQSVRRPFVKLISFILAAFIAFSICHGVFSPSYANPPKHYQDLKARIRSSTESGRGNPNNEKVFIAANIVDESLIRGSWGRNLLLLVDLLGEDNVFVSIYENDSGPGTVAALHQLQQRLSCNSSIVTGDHIPLERFPTVRLPNGEQRVQRITYLAEIRNRLLRPIDPHYSDPPLAGFQSANHVNFDRILFLNDVYYSPSEAVQLLFSTNADSGVAQYRAACAVDFVQFFKLYDTFVVRDTDGYSVPLQFFPWFTHRGSGTSRADVLSLTDAVQVRSCWGGMAAFDAGVFQPRQLRDQPNGSLQLMHTAVKFRSLEEPFWEAAECCLVFADMEEEYGRPSNNSQNGVFLNPYIRTAYSPVTWKWLPFFKRLERMFEPFQYLTDMIKSPENNPRRTHEPGQVVEEAVWAGSPYQPSIPKPVLAASHRLHSKDHLATRSNGHFETQVRQAAPGGFCGKRRMFVMKKDIETANRSRSGRNWENIHVPWDVHLSRF